LDADYAKSEVTIDNRLAEGVNTAVHECGVQRRIWQSHLGNIILSTIGIS
jgi:hypothetical protein